MRKLLAIIRKDTLNRFSGPSELLFFIALPIVFTFLFLAMPSGLVIYWMVSNILTIGQQVITNRIIGSRTPVRAVAVPRKG